MEPEQPVVEEEKKEIAVEPVESEDSEEEKKANEKAWKVDIHVAKEDEVGDIARLVSEKNAGGGDLDSNARAKFVQELSSNFAVFNLKSDPWKDTERENELINKDEITGWAVEKQEKALGLQKSKRRKVFRRLNAICEENEEHKELLGPKT